MAQVGIWESVSGGVATGGTASVTGAASVGGNLTVTGAETVGSTLTVTGVSMHNSGLVSIANPGNAVGLQIQGRSADNLSQINFLSNTASIVFAGIRMISGAILNFVSDSGAGFRFSGGPVANQSRYESATLQPGFLAYATIAQSGISTTTTVSLGGEIFDNAGNFASNTFTAPVTGQYLLNATIQIDLTSGPGAADVWFETSNRTYELFYTGVLNSGDRRVHSASVIADMSAGHTAVLRFGPSSGTWSISGGSTGATLNTAFSGRLLA